MSWAKGEAAARQHYQETMKEAVDVVESMVPWLNGKSPHVAGMAVTMLLAAWVVKFTREADREEALNGFAKAALSLAEDMDDDDRLS
jgi:hypothetical protein